MCWWRGNCLVLQIYTGFEKLESKNNCIIQRWFHAGTHTSSTFFPAASDGKFGTGKTSFLYSQRFWQSSNRKQSVRVHFCPSVDNCMDKHICQKCMFMRTSSTLIERLGLVALGSSSSLQRLSASYLTPDGHGWWAFFILSTFSTLCSALSVPIKSHSMLCYSVMKCLYLFERFGGGWFYWWAFIAHVGLLVCQLVSGCKALRLNRAHVPHVTRNRVKHSLQMCEHKLNTHTCIEYI